MNLKYQFAVQPVGTSYMAVAIGEDARRFRDIIQLNTTGRFIFESLMAGEETESIVAALADKFNVETDVVKAHVDDFIGKLVKKGAVEY